MLFKDNFKDYKIRLTVKACVCYEQLTGKSFLMFGGPDTTEDDALALLYACFIASNSVTVTLSTFKILYGDEKFQKWINNAFAEAMAMHQQFNIARDDEGEEGGEAEGEEVDVKQATITTIAAYLITNGGLSAEYVMDRMQLFEIKPYMKAIDAKEKSHLLEQRLWTYLTIAPHIDTKKIKSPQKLLPFEWENAEIKKQEIDDLRRNKEVARQIIGMDMSALFMRPGANNNTENTDDNGDTDQRRNEPGVRPSDTEEGDTPAGRA